MNNLVDFWFEKINRKKWFKCQMEFDLLCKKNFGELLENYENIKINYKNPNDVLGMIILLDQIPRNIFRGKSSAFKYDKIVLKICLDNLLLSNELSGWKKIFFLMPLKHSEDLRIQKMNLCIWEGILDTVIDDYEKLYERNLNQCKDHFKIIKLYGRFPKRNIVLHRESSLEELMYMEENPKGFI